MNRREFLKRTASTAAAPLAAPQVLTSGAAGRAAASERITVGCIGVGNQGRAVMRNFLAERDAQVVAVCDVKSRELEYARTFVDRHYGGMFCGAYGDFRDVLARDDVDAVLIATPDHWHAPIALAAARAGKDIYLEKPVGVSLAEAQALRAAARRYGTAFQFGTQQRSDARFRLACELVRNGRIGRLRRVNVWCPGSRPGGSTRRVAPPEYLDYDMWLGPAPWSPHTEHRCSNLFPGSRDPYKIWPFICDYCVGWVSGWGIHALDIALWGGGELLAGPFEIAGAGTIPTTGACDTATAWKIAIRYDSGVTIDFRSPAAAAWRRRYGRAGDHGTAFEGSEGWVHVDRSTVSAHPGSLLRSTIGPDEVRLARPANHVRDLLDAVRARRPTICPIDAAFAAETLCQLSAIVLRLRRPLRWNPTAERFVEDAEAGRMLSRAMREPWRV